MARWAALNQDKFYTMIYPKILPHEVVGADGGPLTIEVVKFADTPPG